LIKFYQIVKIIIANYQFEIAIPGLKFCQILFFTTISKNLRDYMLFKNHLKILKKTIKYNKTSIPKKTKES